MAPPSPLPSAATISKDQFDSTLALYGPLIRYLTELEIEKVKKTGGLLGALRLADKQRYEELPEAVSKRKADGAWLDKRELQAAMNWKLKHGKVRPQLPALIASNEEATVPVITKAAFQLYEADPTNLAAPLKQLSELKGVGPATASLLLSMYDEDSVPYFADELFRWVCWDDKTGWKKKIKYDFKEYDLLVEGVKNLTARLGEDTKVVDLEKVAYVCGKLGADDKVAVAVRRVALEMNAKVESAREEHIPQKREQSKKETFSETEIKRYFEIKYAKDGKTPSDKRMFTVDEANELLGSEEVPPPPAKRARRK